MSADIYHGDALELVPDLGEFDAVITDPPYPTGGESSMTEPTSIIEAREMIDGMCQSLIAGVLRSIHRRRKTMQRTLRGRDIETVEHQFQAWMFCDWRQVSFFRAIFLRQGLVSQCCLVWDKGSGGFSPNYHPRHELILYGHPKGSAQGGGNWGDDLIQCKRVAPSQKMHPFDKPVALVEQMLRPFPPGRILDPFCGGGSLLVGAQRLGWDVVGIDISREFVEIAKTRLGNGSHNPARQRVEGQEELL